MEDALPLDIYFISRTLVFIIVFSILQCILHYLEEEKAS